MSAPTLIAVIPAYNAEATIADVVRGVLAHCDRALVVDDGSDDETSERAASAGAVVERLPSNRGKGFALRRGVEKSLAEEPSGIALLDADGQHDPRDLPQLVAAWRAGADLVIGSRMSAAEPIPRARFWTNYIGSRILSWMTGLELPDSQCGFRLLDAAFLRRLDLRSEGYAIESEMLLKAARLGGRVEHVPIRTIYNGGPSYFRPVRDTTAICLAAIAVKVFDEDADESR